MTPRLAVLAALAVAACDGKPDETPQAATLATVGSATPADLAVDVIDTADGKGRYTAKREGRTTHVTFPLAIAQVAPATFHTGQRLGETAAGVVVMVDEYASRATGGRCTDGTEAFIRVFSLPMRRELMAMPVESCISGIKGAEPRAEWLDDGRFRINGSRSATYRIEGTGTLTKTGEQH